MRGDASEGKIINRGQPPISHIQVAGLYFFFSIHSHVLVTNVSRQVSPSETLVKRGNPPPLILQQAREQIEVHLSVRGQTAGEQQLNTMGEGALDILSGASVLDPSSSAYPPPGSPSEEGSRGGSSRRIHFNIKQRLAADNEPPAASPQIKGAGGHSFPAAARRSKEGGGHEGAHSLSEEPPRKELFLGSGREASRQTSRSRVKLIFDSPPVSQEVGHRI